MGYLGRRIGVSQAKAGPSSSDGAGGTGGGILDLFSQGYFNREGSIYNEPGPIPFTFSKLNISCISAGDGPICLLLAKSYGKYSVGSKVIIPPKD